MEKVKAVLDSTTWNEITWHLNNSDQEDEPSTFDYYHHSPDITANWAETYWGRCCTEADLRYSEIMSFKINTNVENKSYPFENALDTDYKTAYVFQPKEKVMFELKMKEEVGYFQKQPHLQPGQLLSEKDTILYPFQFSLINGYIKSEKLYYANARVRTLEVWKNGKHYADVELLDSPKPQKFILNFAFYKTDRIQLFPKSYYKGSKYKDVCITAFQQNLGAIAHERIDREFKIYELR